MLITERVCVRVLDLQVESLEHLELVAAALDDAESTAERGRVRLLAAIESARGMLALRSICTHPRLDALIVRPWMFENLEILCV